MLFWKCFGIVIQWKICSRESGQGGVFTKALPIHLVLRTFLWVSDCKVLNQSLVSVQKVCFSLPTCIFNQPHIKGKWDSPTRRRLRQKDHKWESLDYVARLFSHKRQKFPESFKEQNLLCTEFIWLKLCFHISYSCYFI